MVRGDSQEENEARIHKVRETIAAMPPIVVLRRRNMTALDATGMMALRCPPAGRRRNGALH